MTPEQVAQLDQRFASFANGVEGLVAKARQMLAEGDPPEHVALNIDAALMLGASPQRISGLAAVALVRLAQSTQEPPQ